MGGGGPPPPRAPRSYVSGEIAAAEDCRPPHARATGTSAEGASENRLTLEHAVRWDRNRLCRLHTTADRVDLVERLRAVRLRGVAQLEQWIPNSPQAWRAPGDPLRHLPAARSTRTSAHGAVWCRGYSRAIPL